MTQYLVANHHPDDYDPSLEDEAMERDIDALNDEMKAAWCQDFRWRPAAGKQGEVAAGAARW
jgi:hypothetical protein